MGRHLVVMGPMGVGKTTLAERLAAALDRELRDSDRDIEALFGQTGREIAETSGVEALHRLEAAVLLGALAGSTPTVIAAAGWVIEDQRCRQALARRATVVLLELPNDDLLVRKAEGDQRRPLTATEVEALVDRRRPLFDRVADVRVDAGKHPDDLADEVLGLVTADPKPD